MTPGHWLQSIMAASIVKIVAHTGPESAAVPAFPLRLTEELKAISTAQAARAGISLNQYIVAVVLAAHVDVQAEAERIFTARTAISDC